MRRSLLAIAILTAVPASAHAEEWFIEAHATDRQALARAASQFQHVIIDRKRNVLRVDTDDAGIAMLTRMGLDVHVDVAATAQLRSFNTAIQTALRNGTPPLGASGYPTIPGFSCYRTVEGTYQTMDDLAADHPQIVTIDDIGPTWKKTQDASQGYTMRALRITNLATAAADPDRPKMVVFSSIHAREYAPAEIDTRFAEWLVSGYGSDPEATWLIDHNDFRLILQANPDGRKKAEGGLLWRKNVDSINGNCGAGSSNNGIDLNRNFPFHWNITGGVGSSGYACDETYRGPLQQSEPETDNLVNYVAGTCDPSGECSGGVFADHRDGPMNPPTVCDDNCAPAPDDTRGFFLDIHSYSNLVLWPWGDTSTGAPNQAALRTLGRRLAWFNGYTPEQSHSLYPTDGTTDDTLYGLLGVPAYTFETDTEFFQQCPDFEANTVGKNIAALRYSARTLYAPYRLPQGPDTISVHAGSDLVVAGEPVLISARVDDGRFNQSTAGDSVPGTVRNIASVAAYADQLPWDVGADAVALAPDDGTFDTPAEDVTGSIATTNLGEGRHLIYVQGTDNAGNAGTPSATFVDVADGANVSTLSGRISEITDGAALAATMTLHNPQNDENHQAQSDPLDGGYSAHTFKGVFDVHVSAPHHLSEDLAGVDLAAGSNINHDFALYPNCTILSDDVESGNQGWTAQSPWVISSGVPGNTTHVWNTPNYGDNLNRALTSSTLDLIGYSDVSLDFDDRCDTESGYDHGYVEYSIDAGANWSAPVYSCSGETAWQSHHIELPADIDDSASVKLRLRLQSDQNTNAPGWAVDNIHIEAGGAACRAQQVPGDTIFENGFEG